MPNDRRSSTVTAWRRAGALAAILALAPLPALPAPAARAADPGIRWQFDAGG